MFSKKYHIVLGGLGRQAETQDLGIYQIGESYLSPLRGGYQHPSKLYSVANEVVVLRGLLMEINRDIC